MTNAISLRRANKLIDIETRRKDADASSYTLGRALADAINYHGACSLVAGLEEAHKAVSTIETLTGINKLERVMQGIDKLRSLGAQGAGN